MQSIIPGVTSVNGYGQPVNGFRQPVNTFGTRYNYPVQRPVVQSYVPRIPPQSSFSGHPIQSYGVGYGTRPLGSIQPVGSFSSNGFGNRGSGYGASSFGGYRGGSSYGNGRGNSFGLNGRGVGRNGISRSYPNNPFLSG